MYPLIKLSTITAFSYNGVNKPRVLTIDGLYTIPEQTFIEVIPPLPIDAVNIIRHCGTAQSL